MDSLSDAWLVWGLDHPELGLSLAWSPRANDVWVGEASHNAACTHDYTRLLHGDLSEWGAHMWSGSIPEPLWRLLDSRMDRIHTMFDRTVWGREASFTERRNHIAILARIFYGLIMSRKWKFAFFAAPPHFGFDELLKDILEWSGVPIIYGFQSLFPGRFWLLQSNYDILQPLVPLEPMGVPAVKNESIFYMLSVSARSYGAYRVPLAWLKYWFGLGRSRQQPFYELKRVLRQYRFQRDIAKAFPRKRKLMPSVLNDLQKPFVYFPLHLQPEMTTSALARPGYDSQLRVIEDILRVLPEGWRLLLKENPKQDWRQRSPAFFACISSDPRVYLLDRKTPSKQVISRCSVLATVSGTAGWEALRMQKPVLLFGRSWYAGFTGTYAWQSDISLEGLMAATEESVAHDFCNRMALCFPGVVDSSYLFLTDYNPIKNGVLLHSVLSTLPLESKCGSF